ncbi:glycosyltransferase [Cyanobacteria bacterium FACHB-471]|nr:glycosyltransferase [Cyanobacteria bacterium FACHB-471]
MSTPVVVYRDELLPYSETFIPAQVEHYSTYRGVYVGTTRTTQADALIPVEKSIVLSDFVSSPAVWKTAFKLAGVIHPGWLNALKELSPHLIHAHFGLDGVFALPLAQRLQIPLIVTFHGYFATADIQLNPNLTFASNFFKQRGKFFRELYARRRDRLFQNAHCGIAVSDFIRSQLIAKGYPADKIQVHYIGIDIDQFVPNPRVERESVVLFVGRFVEKKGCQYLIQAMSQVQAVMPEVELVMIGNGPLKPRLEELAKNTLKRYRFLGVQPSTVVREWMNRASVLCAPSLTTETGESEGLPIVVLEAMAMQLPVVSSFHAGIPEAIAHAETGFLSAEKDWQTLAQNILILLQNRELHNQFAIAARNRVEQQFNLKHNTAKLETCYSQAALEYYSRR